MLLATASGELYGLYDEFYSCTLKLRYLESQASAGDSSYLQVPP